MNAAFAATTQAVRPKGHPARFSDPEMLPAMAGFQTRCQHYGRRLVSTKSCSCLQTAAAVRPTPRREMVIARCPTANAARVVDMAIARRQHEIAPPQPESLFNKQLAQVFEAIPAGNPCRIGISTPIRSNASPRWAHEGSPSIAGPRSDRGRAQAKAPVIWSEER